MHLSTIAAGVLLPLMVAAQAPASTTTCTTTQTLTQTVTLKRVLTTTFASNQTSGYYPTGTGASSSVFKAPSTTSSIPIATKTVASGGSALGAANYVVVAIGGAVCAMLL